MQVDATKINELAQAFPDVAKLPLILVFSLVMCFYYFKWTFYGGLTLLICGTIVNYFLAILTAKQQKLLMKTKDKRMNTLTEIVNNIKIIKLNSYISDFS
jgi:ATP-binding cassette subfamily C (CFTR/MRP) protein 1